MFYIFWVLVGPGRRSAYAISKEAGGAYIKSTIVLLVIWVLYPVCWGLADGGNVITTDSEMVFYGVLDILAKPCFILLHLFALSRTNYEALKLQSGHFSVGDYQHQTSEKDHRDVVNGLVDVRLHQVYRLTNSCGGNSHANGHTNGGVVQNTVQANGHPSQNTASPTRGAVPDSNLA